MRKDKTQLRRLAKAKLIAGAIIEIEFCKMRMKSSTDICEYIFSLHKIVALEARLEAIKTVASASLSINGKIDKRRYRRFVTKHRKSRKVRIGGYKDD